MNPTSIWSPVRTNVSQLHDIFSAQFLDKIEESCSFDLSDW